MLSPIVGTGRIFLFLSLLTTFWSSLSLVNAQLSAQNQAQKLGFVVEAPSATDNVYIGESFIIKWKPITDSDNNLDITLRSLYRSSTDGQRQEEHLLFTQVDASLGYVNWTVPKNDDLVSNPETETMVAHQLQIRVIGGKYAYKATTTSGLFAIKENPAESSLKAGVERGKAHSSEPPTEDDSNLDRPDQNYPPADPEQISSSTTEKTSTSSRTTKLLALPTTRITTIPDAVATITRGFKLPSPLPTSTTSIKTPGAAPVTPTDNDTVKTFFNGKMSSGRYLGIILGVIFPFFGLLAFVMYVFVRRKREKAKGIEWWSRFPFCCLPFGPSKKPSSAPRSRAQVKDPEKGEEKKEKSLPTGCLRNASDPKHWAYLRSLEAEREAEAIKDELLHTHNYLMNRPSYPQYIPPPNLHSSGPRNLTGGAPPSNSSTTSVDSQYSRAPDGGNSYREGQTTGTDLNSHQAGLQHRPGFTHQESFAPSSSPSTQFPPPDTPPAQFETSQYAFDGEVQYPIIPDPVYSPTPAPLQFPLLPTLPPTQRSYGVIPAPTFNPQSSYQSNYNYPTPSMQRHADEDPFSDRRAYGGRQTNHTSDVERYPYADQGARNPFDSAADDDEYEDVVPEDDSTYENGLDGGVRLGNRETRGY